ncbi:MAG: glycosyltransferase family 2 protein [Hyphomonadaceae bacterium]
MLQAVAENIAIARRGPEISVVVPTFNERDNVELLVDKIEKALGGEAWEVVFVDDDSTDGTRDVINRMSQRDPRVRCIHRIGRRGLSSAVIEGMLSTSSPFIAVMDADLQHDEAILPDMLANLRRGGADVVIGSRYASGGGVGEWDGTRQSYSRFATMLSKMVLKADVSDPMSGFFMTTREALYGSVRGLSLRGYKVLLDLLASSSKPLKTAELPYQFRTRVHGESKLDTMVAIEFLEMLLDKTIGKIVPTTFIMFMAVGGAGVLVHFAVLSVSMFAFGQQFAMGQTIAAVVAMTFNFFVNNLLTYRDRRLKGFWPVVRGLATFYAVCGLGLFANVGIANYMFAQNSSWWLAAIAGILVGAVWNFAASKVFTWRGA